MNKKNSFAALSAVANAKRRTAGSIFTHGYPRKGACRQHRYVYMPRIKGDHAIQRSGRAYLIQHDGWRRV